MPDSYLKPEHFSAQDKAMQIELMAREIISNPKEDNPALKKFSEEIHELFKDPQKMSAVGTELTRMRDENFSTLPNAEVSRNPDGSVEEIHFSKSFWDRKSENEASIYSDSTYSHLYRVITAEEKAEQRKANSNQEFWSKGWGTTFLPSNWYVQGSGGYGGWD